MPPISIPASEIVRLRAGSVVRGLSFSGGSLCNSVLPVLELRRVIAATALVHGMTIVTRNTADFELTGVQILNPWTWAGSW